MVLFLNYKLVMLSSAITLVIILTSNTVLVTSSSESHHFVQHPQARQLLPSLDGFTKFAGGLGTRIAAPFRGLSDKLPLQKQPITNTPFNGAGRLPTSGKTSYNKFSKKDKRNYKKAVKEGVDEFIDQSSACPVLGYNPNPINQLIYFSRDNDQNIRYVDCNSLNNDDPSNSLANSKSYPNPMYGKDLRPVSEYRAQLLPNSNKYSHIGEIYVPINL